MSLNELNPLIQMMDMEKMDLISAMDSLPDGDGLKDILNETLITASLEVAKFKRGDYFNA